MGTCFLQLSSMEFNLHSVPSYILLFLAEIQQVIELKTQRARNRIVSSSYHVEEQLCNMYSSM